MHGKTLVIAVIGEDDIWFEEVSCLPKYANEKSLSVKTKGF